MEPDHSPAASSTKEPEPTRQRILEAARTEFAAFGLAGARIDRIARNASASKERLYAYYRHKAELFSAVLELNLGEFAEAMAGAGGTLPEFAGALYDHSVAHPEHLRVIDWARLERQDVVELRLPAESAYLSVLRTATAGLAARLDFTLDEIEDLRIAVDEACGLLLDHQTHPGAELLAAFTLHPNALDVLVHGPVLTLPRRSSFAWSVLEALVGQVETGTATGGSWIRLTHVGGRRS